MALAIWITGLPASGKTTMATLLESHLKSKNIPVMILDGDEIRKTLSKDLDSHQRTERSTTGE